MNKYSVLMLLPILFQINIYADAVVCPDLDMLIKNELQAAQIVMNKPVKLELQSVLDALVAFARKSKNNRSVGIECILLIQKAIQKCKSQQYTSWNNFTRLLGYHPELVTKEIQPALTYINNILINKIKASSAELEKAKNNLATIRVGIGSAILLASGITALAYWHRTQENENAVSDLAEQADANFRSQRRKKSRNGQVTEEANNPFL